VDLVDSTLLASIFDKAVALQRRDLVFPVGFDRLDEFPSAIPRVEEIGFGRDLGSVLGLLDELFGQLDFRFCIFLVQPETQWIAGLVVGIEAVDEVLAPDEVALSVVVKSTDVGNFVAGLLGE